MERRERRHRCNVLSGPLDLHEEHTGEMTQSAVLDRDTVERAVGYDGHVDHELADQFGELEP